MKLTQSQLRTIIREELKDAITETESSDEEFHRLFRPHFENSDLGPRDIGAYNLHVRGLLRDRGYEMPEDMAAAHSLARRAINRVKAAKRLKR